MQNRIVFTKNVSILEQKRVLAFVKLWENEEKTIMVSTSGSTGNPKKIELSKDVMKASALATGQFFNFKKNEKNLLALSADYIAGKMQIVRALVFEMQLIVAPVTSNPLAFIEESNIDFAAFVPLQVQSILNNSKTKSKINTIRNVIIGGATINSALLNDIYTLKNANYATFGMTETVSHIALKALKNGSNLYKALPTVSFNVNENDCLIIRAPYLSPTPFYTNDRVELKDKFSFKWIGRADHVINSGGIKIQPELIEAKINHLITKPFYISKIPDLTLGEKVVLYIEGSEGSLDERNKLHNDIYDLLSPFERPKIIQFKSIFKRTQTGKIIRE